MYIPIMKNRTVEISALGQLASQNVFGQNVIPLIELIQEKTRSNNKNTFLEDLASLLSENSNMKIMVDCYKSIKLRNTTDQIREYITRTVRQPEFFVCEMEKLSDYSDRVIPVISYLTEGYDLGRIKYEADILKEKFPRLAYRIKVADFERAFGLVCSMITPNDILIFDIDSAPYLNPVLRKIYNRISVEKKKTHFTTVIVNSPRHEDLTNRSMTDREPIADIDNSIKDLYDKPFMYKFDGFGDYACITSSLPTTGGTISPVGIYYSLDNNFFISYSGRMPLLSEFPDYIAPSICESEYWQEFEDEHHSYCPGCREILSIVDGEKSGKNQAQWKMITMMHYIYTMYESNA